MVCGATFCFKKAKLPLPLKKGSFVNILEKQKNWFIISRARDNEYGHYSSPHLLPNTNKNNS